ncbi:hypothetical protein PIB30_015706 [Stylosanthes scabra]|uniref:Polygalacturonase n=1 Tax=Stylosanthes scabra TaxID=79078 RepID=A0ABU6V6B2_9FABA|nr:hypothetical protein [Stylosanthes scabra]
MMISGDDCVSIQTGCSKVHVHHIMCGPGHGISLGGLGKDRSVACVSDIIVEHISLKNTLYGARIKTWQGGNGMVKNVTFSRIQVYDVMFPIMIDQYYCDYQVCKNQTGAVVISGVKFNQISGTYGVQPIHLACSNSIPCTDVDLIDIQLRPSIKFKGLLQQAMCWNSYGTSHGPLLPSGIDYCLRSGGSGLIKRIARDSPPLLSLASSTLDLDLKTLHPTFILTVGAVGLASSISSCRQDSPALRLLRRCDSHPLYFVAPRCLLSSPVRCAAVPRVLFGSSRRIPSRLLHSSRRLTQRRGGSYFFSGA